MPMLGQCKVSRKILQNMSTTLMRCLRTMRSEKTVTYVKTIVWTELSKRVMQ